jgi:hypothetical protein
MLVNKSGKFQKYNLLTMALAFGFFAAVSSLQAAVVETGKPQTLTQTAQVEEIKAGPAPFSIVLTPQKQKLKTGEKLNVDVLFSWQDGVTAAVPAIPQPFGDWVVVSQHAGSLKKNPNTGIWERTDKLTLMTYLDGKVELPAISAKVQVPKQGELEVRSAVITLEVDPKLNKKGELEAGVRDVKNPIWMISIWQILLAVLVALILLFIIAWYSQKAGLLDLSQKHELARPPEETAREKLKALKNSPLLESGNFKEYYIELTNILRSYLEGRYSISALDRTTSELMKELKHILERKDIATFRDLLERSDVIKFAKGSPDYKEIELDWNSVSDFVEKTTQAFIESQKPKLKNDEGKGNKLQISEKSGNDFTSQGRES